MRKRSRENRLQNLAGPLLALTLCWCCVANAQKFTPLPATPKLRGQIDQYAAQVAQKKCLASTLRTGYVAGTVTPELFAKNFQSYVDAVSLQATSVEPRVKVMSNMNGGTSGYVYIRHPQPNQSVLAILSVQTIQKRPALVRYSCKLAN